jgi:hypothetical protein
VAGARRESAGGGLRLSPQERPQELAHGHTAGGVILAEWVVRVHLVEAAIADAVPGHAARLHQLVDEPMRGALRQANGFGDLPQPASGHSHDLEQHADGCQEMTSWNALLAPAI